MALSAGETYSGGQVRDSKSRTVVISETTNAALTAGEFYSAGFLCDPDSRTVICQDAAHSALAAGETLTGGDVRDKVGRIACAVETLNAPVSAGSQFSGGFLRDSRGRRIIAVDTLGAALSAGEVYSSGQVLDSAGRLVLASEGGGSAYDTAVLADTPVAFWPLKEPSGTTATDVTGNGHGGTYTGGFTLGAAGPCSDGEPAVTLDGITGYIPVPLSAALQPANVTVETWVYSTDIVRNCGYVCSNAFMSNVGYLLSGNVPGALNAQVGIYHGSAWTNYGVNTLTANAWHHVAGTLDGTTITVYLDGAPVASGPQNGALIYDPAEFRIGCDYLTNYFQGRIAKVAVYNHVLTPARIAAHYAAR